MRKAAVQAAGWEVDLRAIAGHHGRRSARRAGRAAGRRALPPPRMPPRIAGQNAAAVFLAVPGGVFPLPENRLGAQRDFSAVGSTSVEPNPIRAGVTTLPPFPLQSRCDYAGTHQMARRPAAMASRETRFDAISRARSGGSTFQLEVTDDAGRISSSNCDTRRLGLRIRRPRCPRPDQQAG